MKLFLTSMMLSGLLLILAACAVPGRPLSQEDMSSLILCAAGGENGLSAKLTGKIKVPSKEIETELSFSEKVKTAIFSESTINSSDKVLIYNSYLGCIDKFETTKKEGRLQVQAKNSEIESCRVKLACEIEKLDSVCRCRTIIESEAGKAGLGTNATNKLIMSECYNSGSSINTCWSNDEISSARIECTSLLTANNTDAPAPAKNTCLYNSEHQSDPWWKF